jgi:chromosome segregation ATPase
MKKFISGITAAAMVLTLSTGAIACKENFQVKNAAPKKIGTEGKKVAPGTVKTLDAEALAKIQALKDAYNKEVAPLNEQLKTITADLKAAKAAKPVDTAKVKAIKDVIASINKEIGVKQANLTKEIEKVKLVAEYGADAIDKIEVAKAAFEKDVAPLNEKLNTLNSDLRAALKATTVDKEKVKSLKDQIKKVSTDIASKKKALATSIEKIKMIAKYGADAVDKLEAAKAAYDKDVAAVNEKIKTVNGELKSVLKVTPIDKEKIKALKDQLYTLYKELNDKKTAYEALVKSIKTTATKTA